MKTADFSSVRLCCGLEMKERHTLVERWPLKLKAKAGDPDAQKEFDLLQASMHSGGERYVEWRRVPQHKNLDTV